MKTISMKILAVLVTALTLLTTSCKKDDDIAPDKTKILTSGSWQLTAMTVDPAIDWFGTPVTNVYSQLPACVKDDLAIFKANGTVNYDEGASKCNPNDPQTTTGTWTFNTDQTVLSITQDGETESWNVSDLGGSSFKANYQVVQEGITYTFSVVFSKK
ncbi:MAG TPA: DUF5004 domain-containing protein [Flavilitoribacter sp.]|nr:DUF5004 domain-containing protein [Flavilitoribacter sp.]HMQ90965.1 DUF5004 domain-containing protein [Flavilitoribacter sp.]